MKHSGQHVRSGLLCLLLLLPGLISAQSDVGISLSGQYGFVWAHTRSMRHLSTSYLRGSEISMLFQPGDSSGWGKNYGFPYYGLTAGWVGLQNDKLGNGYFLSGFIDLPALRRKNMHLLFRPSTGLGYLPKHYDPSGNFQNIAVGSSVNIAIQFSLLTRFKLSDKLSATTGLSLGHFSNGATRYPNLGINMPAFTAGIAWHAGGIRNWESDGKAGNEFTPKTHFEVLFTGGLKGLEAGVRDVFPVYTFRGQVARRVSIKSSVTAGPDLFYSSLLGKGLRIDSDTSNPSAEALRAGIFLGYQLHINQFAYYTGMGVYAYAPYRGDGLFYHRFGVRYEAGRAIFLLGIKSHFAVADNVEVGVGYRLN